MKGKPFRVVVVCLLTTLVLCHRSLAQQPADNKSAVNPLVRVLQAKGILTAEEVAQISQASSASDAEQRLAKLLLMKGVISQSDYDQTVSAPGMMNASSSGVTSPTAIAAVYRVPINNGANVAPLSTIAPPASHPSDQAPSAGPTFIPAIMPIRPFPVGGLPREGLKPAFSIGSIRVTPFGFVKATFVHDTSSPYGDDFPLPGFLLQPSSVFIDSGPGNSPEFHVKARSSRIGTNFEWLDPSPNLTITGRFEIDFEGNFSRVDNRNLSSIRSSMPSIRLAYGRIDYRFGEKDTFSALFGQDWTPFGSSTLPSLLETTGLGLAFGTLYERAPQMRVGWTHDFSSFRLMPEVALVLPASGNTPANVVTNGLLTVTGVASQLAYGERQGPDSGRPQVQARIVGQFQLDHAPGVAPAQLIVSGMDGRRQANVLAAQVPQLLATNPLGINFFRNAFPHGATVSTTTTGWSGEFQLPTRYMTLVGKYYGGSDLRYFFAGQLLSNFNDTFGLTNINTAPSVDGASTVVFATNANGNAVVAPQRPVRSRGGFVNLGLPLSRLFGADPQGRNMGWSMYFHYGVDFAKARDAVRVGATGTRHKSPLYAGTIYYKLNNWVTFAFEQSLYETYGVILPATGNFPLANGVPSRVWRDVRSEGGTIFTF